jgi:hypothetical protein
MKPLLRSYSMAGYMLAVTRCVGVQTGMGHGKVRSPRLSVCYDSHICKNFFLCVMLKWSRSLIQGVPHSAYQTEQEKSATLNKIENVLLKIEIETKLLQ